MATQLKLIAAGAALAALTSAGCMGSRSTARRDDSPATPASYDIVSQQRTDGRDQIPAPASADGLAVQQSYDRARSARRASGAVGTDGEAQRAQPGADGATVGGSSAGSTAQGAQAQTAPIPYAGSQQIGEAFVPAPSAAGGAASTAGAANAGAPAATTTIAGARASSRDANPGTQGIPDVERETRSPGAVVAPASTTATDTPVDTSASRPAVVNPDRGAVQRAP